MKETYYFSHDYSARADMKLVNVTMKHGMAGIGAYWCIIEMLYQEGGYLSLQYENIAYQLREDISLIESIINDFQLFEKDKKSFWSKRVLEHLKFRAEKSEKARGSVNRRWKKYDGNSNELQTNNNPNTIKESIGQDNKVKDTEQHDMRAEERIHKENPKPKSIPAGRKKNLKCGIQNESSGIFHEAEEGFSNHIICARAPESQILLEEDFNPASLNKLNTELEQGMQISGTKDIANEQIPNPNDDNHVALFKDSGFNPEPERINKSKKTVIDDDW